MKKSKNILILYFLAILIFLFVSLPLFNRYLEQKTMLAVEMKKLERDRAYIDELKKVEREFAPYLPTLNEIKSGLPADPELPSLVKYLEELMVDFGLHLSDISSFSTIDSPTKPHLRETTLEVTFVGYSYASIKSFMQEIERSIRLISIVSAEISPVAPVADEEGEPRLSLIISLKTYSQKDDQ